MRVIFVGCVEFSRAALRALLESDVQIVGVITVDDLLRPQISDFATFEDLLPQEIPIFKFQDINDPAVVSLFQFLKPDLLFVIGWSWLVQKHILSMPKMGAIGLHPTLLPEGRGRAPIPWTLLKGLEKSGVSLFYLNESADAGDLIRQKSFPVQPSETARTLYTKVCRATYDVVREALPLIAANRVEKIKQDDSKATLWPRRRPEEGLIRWNDSTLMIDRLIRAVTHPYPGAFTFLGEKKIFIWSAKPGNFADGIPGTVLSSHPEKGVVIKTGDGSLIVNKIQLGQGNESQAASILKEGDFLHVI